jgi:transcriptional regulator with XRE-family HTH domain
MIGERLFELRKDRGLTQRQVAGELSVSKHTIANYETERTSPNIEMLKTLSLFYNTSVDYLVGVTDVERPIENDKTVLRLPCKLPPKAVSDIKEYINLIMIKYNIR